MALCIVGGGMTHAETLDEQVGRLYGEGKYAEAETLAKQSLEQLIKENGPDHPDTATSLNNLAVFYATQGKYDLAEPLYERGLAINEKALGPDHPETAKS
jgi:tetratricopeptide (TPR) repeat protein